MAEVVLKHKGSYKMKCLVVDDESIAIRGIVNYISKLDFLEVAGSCSSALEAADILKTTEIDLMFWILICRTFRGLNCWSLWKNRH